MAMQSDYRGYVAQGAVGAYRIVKQGTADQSCALASAATDALISTSDSLAHNSGEVVDVGYGELGEVILGGSVTRGQPLTSDANAAAVVAAPAAGSNVRIIGFADKSGAAGDVIPYQRAPGFMQG